MVFTGLARKHFCGGNDFREFATLTPEETLAGTGAVCEGMKGVRPSHRRDPRCCDGLGIHVVLRL